MANDIVSKPARIDTFGADVQLSDDDILVSAFLITVYGSAKTVTFVDKNGDSCFVVEVPATETVGKSIFITGSKPLRFSSGLIFDDNTSDLEAGDLIFIYFT